MFEKKEQKIVTKTNFVGTATINLHELREFLKKELMKICHTRGIIVGCAGAGKTTLLMRLQDMPYKELEEIKTTEIVDVHVNSFDVLEKLTTIKGKLHIHVIHTTYYCTLL